MSDVIVPMLQAKIFEEVPPEMIQLAYVVYSETAAADWQNPDWYKSFGPKASSLKDLWADRECVEMHLQLRALYVKHCLAEVVECLLARDFEITGDGDTTDTTSYKDSLVTLCRSGQKFLTTSLEDIAVLDANKFTAAEWTKFWVRVFEKATQL
eukprot:567353-Pyramimonas_sp.AAC.1